MATSRTGASRARRTRGLYRRAGLIATQFRFLAADEAAQRMNSRLTKNPIFQSDG
jgi:hypothetical protein